jgi:DNA polymerase IV
MDYKAKIIEAFEILQKKESLQTKEADKTAAFKANRYKTVIEQLSLLPHIRSMEDVRGVKGIGVKIHAKLVELFATGSLQSAKVAKEVVNESDALLRSYGIGPAKAKELRSYGISTIAQLRAAVKKNPEILSAVQTIGLHYYEPLLLRIPRAEMREHEVFLHKVIEPFQKGHIIRRADLVGSYRRGAATSGDIDVLLEGEDPTILIDIMHSLTTKK